jgi:hypothetical protein
VKKEVRDRGRKYETRKERDEPTRKEEMSTR